MTKGDRDKLRADIAGRVLAAVMWRYRNPKGAAIEAVEFTDALLDRLGLSEKSEEEAIRKVAEELRGSNP